MTENPLDRMRQQLEKSRESARDGFDNAFQVFVLAKGNFTLREDPFLSPYFPTVEEIAEGG